MSRDKISLEQFNGIVTEKTGKDSFLVKEFNRELFSLISGSLQAQEKVPIYKFGSFQKKWTKTRRGVNPQTGRSMMIPAHYRVHFSPSSVLANEVNRKYRHLKPNVVSTLLTLTGITKIDPVLKQALEKDESLFQKYRKTFHRAVITLVILLVMALAFLGTVIIVPVYFYNENNRIVSFTKKVNRMFGLDSLSDKLAKDRAAINEEEASRFIRDTKEDLLLERDVTNVHIVRSGDSIFSIAKQYWDNEYLWPDLYVLNQDGFADPDIIYPGDTIKIYQKLGNPRDFSKSQRDIIVQAYIGTYRIYRALGELDIKKGKVKKGNKRIADSRWTLYTALRYDNDLLKRYSDAVYPEDNELLLKYIEKFGYDGKKIQK
jgi:nucleoid DNA-binding protein